MSIKIAFIGAGSVGFSRKLLKDLLSVPELADTRVSFMDVSEPNLNMVAQIVRRDMEANGIDPAQLSTTLDQTEAVRNASYVLNVARVGGLEAFATDIEIPLRYGIDQCVGDTLGPGGIMYGQRGIPMILSLCRDIRDYAAPDAMLLNYANPMAMMTWAANTYGGVRTVGLCHGVQGGHQQIADVLELPQDEVDIVCAGINHQTWYVRVEHRGRDMTGRLLEAFENHPTYRETEKVRIDMLRRFGYYSTESNGHLSEYLPWYRKRPEELRDWISLENWIHGETGGYLRECTEKRNWFEEEFPRWMDEDPERYSHEDRSNEHGSYIIESLETGRAYRGHFNVINSGAISNLPNDCVVEVPGYVDRLGVHIPRFGELPMGPAAVCNTSVSVQRLSVEASVHADDRLLRQAFMMDPLTGAVCTPPEIWQLADDMLVAGEKWLPQYGGAIEEAAARAKTEPRIPTREYEGAARLKVRSVEELRKEEGLSR